MASIYLITPPFTQLNTPYPATAYLKGFFNTKGISAFQSDLGIEVTRLMFSQKGLATIFNHPVPVEISANAARILALKQHYMDTIEVVMQFLSGDLPTLAQHIARGKFLPEAGRFEQAKDLGWAFGTMGVQDKAKHLATLYLEDISDYIRECVDSHFGFSRYAEKLGRSANQFDELYAELLAPESFVDRFTLPLLAEKIEQVQPQLVAISVPFPGNLYAAFRCAQLIRKNYPNIKVAMGGGFANTELRSLSDPRVFEFFHYITLDDGEAPLENLIQHIQQPEQYPITHLKRTFLLEAGQVVYRNNTACADYKQGQVGTPDYSDLLLHQYISAIEVMNPMHSLWSDGRWLKLTMAHGCYWAKCTFCDISLDYIKNYEPLTAGIICDRMETMIAQTGQRGFHFVDEAAPPSLMRALALEILRRKLVVSWWTNIRFEKSFTRDLCLLLRAAGCIGVSGGLEVASDRLLQLISKGITVAQVANVNQYFTDAGIMVHAYLMYGFPTQTAQETIDSLEMVRQLFEINALQSGYWHQFAMTSHSPVGRNPEQFKVIPHKAASIGFADNDVAFEDPTGADHESFSFGLKKSIHNFMQGVGFDIPVHKWFEHKVPKTTVAPDYIKQAIEAATPILAKPSTQYVFLGAMPSTNIITKSKKGMQWELMQLQFETKTETIEVKLDKAEGEWLVSILPTLQVENMILPTRAQLVASYEAAGLPDFDLFWDNKPMNQLYKAGLLSL
ncbi:MAG: hypothetical protein RLY16_2137 [Bacteroidota bacterium]